jgi:hypothetical protein
VAAQTNKSNGALAGGETKPDLALSRKNGNDSRTESNTPTRDKLAQAARGKSAGVLDSHTKITSSTATQKIKEKTTKPRSALGNPQAGHSGIKTRENLLWDDPATIRDLTGKDQSIRAAGRKSRFQHSSTEMKKDEIINLGGN